MTNHARTLCKLVTGLLAVLALASCGELDTATVDESTTAEPTTTAESTTTTQAQLSDGEAEAWAREMALMLMVSERWPELTDTVQNEPEVFYTLGEAVCDLADNVETGEEMGMAALLIYYSEVQDGLLGDVITDESQFAELVGITAAAVGCEDRLNELK